MAATQLRQILAAHAATGASQPLRVLDDNNHTAEIVLALPCRSS